MNSTKTGIYVKILDREFQVACPEGIENELTKAAEILDNKMQEIRNSGKIVGVERIAIMAALNLAHDMLQKQQQKVEYINSIDERIRCLQEKIDAALEAT